MTSLLLMEQLAGAWRRLNGLPPAELRDARLQAHWAVQAVASVGLTLGEPQSDDSHTSMSWLEGSGLLAGVTGTAGFGAALRLRDLTLVVHDGDGGATETLSLDGESLGGARQWLAEALGRAAEQPPIDKFARPSYTMPEHPTGAGARFAWTDPAPFEQLVRWYSNAALLISIVATHSPGASPVRCWPHHFDIATMITLNPGEADGEKIRSITFGMSPGDQAFDEPYFYVTSSPAPGDGVLPNLKGGGVWHREGWTGSVLTASALVSPVADQQAGQVSEFADSALAAARELLA